MKLTDLASYALTDDTGITINENAHWEIQLEGGQKTTKWKKTKWSCFDGGDNLLSGIRETVGGDDRGAT
jgi:hypothetical protein